MHSLNGRTRPERVALGKSSYISFKPVIRLSVKQLAQGQKKGTADERLEGNGRKAANKKYRLAVVLSP